MYVNLKCPECGKEVIKRKDAKTCGDWKCQKSRQRKLNKEKKNDT